MFYFQAKKKNPNKIFEVKSEGKKKKIVTEQAASPRILKKKKQWTASPTSSPRQAQEIINGSKPIDSQKKKKKTNILKSETNGQCKYQTLIDVERKKERKKPVRS